MRREGDAKIDGPDEPSPESASLPKIPRYEVKQVLGRGGMGVVYLAHDTRLGRDVALKMLAGGAVSMPETRARFQVEAEAVARVQHPGIAQIFDVGEVEGQPYLTMEYLGGGTLDDRLRQGPDSPREAAGIVETLGRSVHACHAHEILHRDLKPANVLVAEDGALKITDFGLAKFMQHEHGATQTGQVMGTPNYMAPEQASGVVRKLGPACDIYALGAILYELVTGRPPFQSPDSIQTLLMVISEEPVHPRRLQPKLPRDLETICLKCLDKSPAKRYSSALELAGDLERFRKGEPILARPIPWWERGARWSRRRPAAAALIAVIALSLTVLIGGGTWYNARLRAELDRSQQLFDEGQELSHWMLFDHSEALGRLQGSTRPQEQFVTRMLAYLDAMTPLATDDDALLHEIAMAYRRVAEVQGDPNYSNLGQTDASLQSYRQATAIYARLLANAPNDALLLRERALCRASCASLLALLGRREEAIREMDRALSELRRLAARPGHGVPLRQALAVVLQQRAELARSGGMLERAAALYEEALGIARQIYQEDPRNADAARLLATAHSHVGRIDESAGRIDEAKRHYRQALDSVEEIVLEKPNDVRTLRDLSVVLIHLGDLSTRDGQWDPAMESYRRAVEMRRKQARIDPHSATIQRDLSVAIERMARVHEERKDYAAMIGPIQESIEITRQLAGLDPGNTEHRRDLWIKQATLGRAFMYLGRFDEAVKRLQSANQTARELAALDEQSSVDLQGVAQTGSSLGDIAIARIGPTLSLEESIRLTKEAMQFYRASLTSYEHIERRQGLSRQQKELRDAVRKKLEFARGAVEQLQRPENPGRE